MSTQACVVWGQDFTRYDFGAGHPMGPLRIDLTARLAQALGVLRQGATGDANLLALAVEAARARATLGEISAAMEAGFGRYGQIVARLVYEPLTERPSRLYGESGSHYQNQGLKLSKHFRVW